MRNTLLAVALLLAAATPAFSEDICYTFHLTAMRGQVHIRQASGSRWLDGYAGGCDDCWTGIGQSSIGGIPTYTTFDYDIAVRLKSYETATVRCLRDACILRVDDSTTYELARNQSVDVPSETLLTLTAMK